MRPGYIPIILFLLWSPSLLTGQNLPDRIIIFDPLGDTTVGTEDFIPLPGTRLYGEFSHYGYGTGATHRWNAKLGGYAEFARWNTTWSIALAGTMEVIVDSTNDIEFNPRAIFWEEGIIVSALAPWDRSESIQFGYMHRCKHDIDNIERFTGSGEIAQRTLIFSGPFLRFLNRPIKLLDGPLDLYAGSSLRLDWFLHTLDSRWGKTDAEEEWNIEDLIGSLTVGARFEGRFPNNRIALHASASYMLTLLSPGDRTAVEGKAPFAEFGLDFYNPRGAAFTIFTRGEWQRDDGILTTPTPASLFLFGVRTSSFVGMW